MDDWALAGIAVVLIAYAAVSGRLASTPVTQAMVFVAVGLLAGDRVLGLIEADAAGQFVRHLAEATLTLVLFTDAVRVNRGRLRRESLVPARLLGVGLPLTIVAGTVAGLALLPGLDLWTAAALATMLAPTDAALGLPVVSNRRLPSRIRQGLNVESGLNDGVCVPLLIIFLTIAQAEDGVGHVEPVKVVLEEIGFGALGGILAGVVSAWVLRTFAGKGLDRPDLAADYRGGHPAAGLHGGQRARRQRVHRPHSSPGSSSARSPATGLATAPSSASSPASC